MEMNEIFSVLDDLLGSANLDSVTADGAGFQELPDGYYLSEIESAEIKVTSKTNKPMVSMRFNVVEDGLAQSIDDYGNTELIAAKRTANRKIFMNWVISDTASVERYVSDMLKFEDSDGNPILEKTYFITSATMVDALDIITGSRIYIMVQTIDRNGEKVKKQNLVKWATAKNLGLPV